MVEVSEILERIKAKRSFSSNSIFLNEGRDKEIFDDITWLILSESDESLLKRLGLGLKIVQDRGELRRFIDVGNIVGSMRLSTETGELTINVEPKLPIKNITEVINYVEHDLVYQADKTKTYSGIGDLLNLQIQSCISNISFDLRDFSLFGYSEKKESLQYIKGKANPVDLVLPSQNGLPNLVRCEYSDITLDTPKNKLFKTALLKCCKILQKSKNTKLRDQASQLLFKLDTVQEELFTSEEISRLLVEQPGSRLAILSSFDVINNLTISSSPGLARSFFSYQMNLSDLFEKFCRTLFASALSDFKFRTSELTFRMEGIDKGIRLDGLYKRGKSKILIECKYKVVLSTKDLNV